MDRNRFSDFSDAELTELWKGLTTDDGISYGMEESSQPEYSLAVEMLDEAKRRGIADSYLWEAVV